MEQIYQSCCEEQCPEQGVFVEQLIDNGGGQFVRPNVGGGKFAREEIHVSCTPHGNHKYIILVKPVHAKVIKGIDKITTSQNGEEISVVSHEEFTNEQIQFEISLTSPGDVVVSVDWKCNTMDKWPPTLDIPVHVDNKHATTTTAKVK